MKNIIISLLVALLPLATVCCKKEGDEQPPHRFQESIVIDGWERSYLVNLPPDYYKVTTSRPLVLALHGTGGSAAQFEKDYAFTEKADRENFVVVYADGIRKQDGRLGIRTWNAGACCDYASYANINDTKFLGTLIDNCSNRFNIDRKRIYIAGMSNGSMMAYRLAADIPGKIAAIACVSGNMVYSKDLSKQAAVPLLHIHSVVDTKVPFNGGTGIGNYIFPPAMEGIHYFAAQNGCDTNAVEEHFDGYIKRFWKNGTGETRVECYLTADGGHSWPGAPGHRPRADPPSRKIDANDLIWDFFSRFSLP
jgi:polyhydroxybutyrate depolymerase